MEVFDKFGQEITIVLNGKNFHQTKVGSLLTISFFILLLVRSIFLVINTVQGQDPIVLFQEKQVDNIKRFDIDTKTFNFALNMKDFDYNDLKIENLFEMQAYHETKIPVQDKDTGKQLFEWKRQYFNLEQCTDDHFQIKDSKYIFESTKIHNLYCLPKNMTLYIEGDFNSDYFAQIIVGFKKCKGPQCYDDTYIKEKIKAIFITTYFSDVYLSPNNRDIPFTFFGRDIFWEHSNLLKKNVYIELRNNIVETDFGFFGSDVKTDVFPSFQNSYESLSDKTDDQEGYIMIRYDRSKENHYKRSYFKALQIMSEIGGFSSVLTGLGILLTAFYTKMHLKETLINNTFTFNELNQSQISGIQQKEFKQEAKKNRAKSQLNINNHNDLQKDLQKNELKVDEQNFNSMDLIFSNQNLKPLKNNHSPPQSYKDQQIKSHQADNCHSPSEFEIQTNRIRQQSQTNKQKGYDSSNKQDNQENITYDEPQNVNQEETNSKVTRINNSSSFKFNLCEYFLSIIFRFGNFQRKKAIFDESIKQLQNCIDLQFIINKLSEIDKLKRIIFNDDQLMLFDYLPKPSIYYSFNKEKVVFHKIEDYLFQPKQKDKQENIQEATCSFLRLRQNNKKQINSRIIQYLDQNYKNLFNQRAEHDKIQLFSENQLKDNQNKLDISAGSQSKQYESSVANGQEYFVNFEQESNANNNVLKYSQFQPSPRLKNTLPSNFDSIKDSQRDSFVE